MRRMSNVHKVIDELSISNFVFRLMVGDKNDH